MTAPARLAAATLLAVAFASGAAARDDGAVWSSGLFDDPQGERRIARLDYGIPETDAIGLSASCGIADPEAAVAMDVLVDFGARRNAEPVIVRLGVGDHVADHPAAVFVASGAYEGVRLAIPVNDPLWAQMLHGGVIGQTLRAGVPGEPERAWPLAGASVPLARFLAACTGTPSGAPQAGTAQIIADVYECQSGERVGVDYYNLPAFSAAVVTVDGGPPVSLINVVAASGALYTNGALSLHSKADDALLIRGDAVTACTAVP